MTALIIIFSIALLLTILLIIPSVIEYELTIDGGNVKNKLVFKYAFIKIVLSPKEKKKNKPSKKEKKQFSFSQAKETFKYIKRVYSECKHDIALILKYAGKHAVKIRQLDVNVKFDFENPMNTGIATGTINGVVYNALALIDNTVGIDKHDVQIEPLFLNTKYFNGKIYSIVKLKNVHIMIILIKLAKAYFKIRKIK